MIFLLLLKTHSPHHWTYVTVSPWEQWVAEKIVPKQTPGWSSGSHLWSKNAMALFLKIKQDTECKKISAQIQTVIVTISIHHKCIVTARVTLRDSQRNVLYSTKYQIMMVETQVWESFQYCATVMLCPLQINKHIAVKCFHLDPLAQSLQ